jgi:UDPglucose 6-dehydrogenase
MTQTTLTVLGAGYVGLTTGALLAHAGYKVFIVEPNAKRLEAIKSGRSFFYEHGLDAIIASALALGNLVPTDSYEESIPHSSVVFSAVGTPDNVDGSSNLDYVFTAANEAAKHMQDGSLFVQKSTVPVGTGARVEELFADQNPTVHYVSNPEFLREGTAVADTLYFDRVVTGGQHESANNAVLDIYRQLEQHRSKIASLTSIQHPETKGIYISTSLSSAELIKVTANAFLALKISFANSIAQLADVAGADIVEVMDAVGADNRIGRQFLNAGRGYGGGCFPKDVSGLIATGNDLGVDLTIMRAAQQVNEEMPGYILHKLQEKVGGALAKKRVALLGLSFKAGTSDTRKSPGIAIAHLLHRAEAIVSAYDPKANEEAAEEIGDHVTLHESVKQAIKGAEIIVIATDWDELINYPMDSYKDSGASIVVDAVNRLDAVKAKMAGLTYIGVGRS